MSYQPPDELFEMLEAACDDRLTPEQGARLEEILQADPQARECYLRYLTLDADLSLEFNVPSTNILPTPARAAPPLRQVAGWRWPYLALAASFLPLALAVAFWFPARSPEAPTLAATTSEPVAMLVAADGPVWGDGKAVAPGSLLPTGRVTLETGQAQVGFASGATITLLGPAELDATTGNSATLLRGKLTATIPEEARGFTLGAPGVVVTDRGSEFGLQIGADDRTEVHVFAGEVRAALTAIDDRERADVRISEKHAVRVDASRHTMDSIPMSSQGFPIYQSMFDVIDATVRDGIYADQNFGREKVLSIKNDAPNFAREAYLRFDLTNLQEPIDRAIIRLTPIHAGRMVQHAAALVDDQQWTESGITWNNRPTFGAVIAQWTIAPTPQTGKPQWVVAPDRRIEFDATAAVRQALAGNRKLGLRLFATENVGPQGWSNYASRQNAPANWPQLIVNGVEPHARFAPVGPFERSSARARLRSGDRSRTMAFSFDAFRRGGTVDNLSHRWLP